MKKITGILTVVMALTIAVLPATLKAQADKTKLLANSATAKAAFIKTDDSMGSLFHKAYAYVIFPNVGKGGFIVGGAGGNGIVYDHGKAIGSAKMVQVNVGAQIGGQKYREVIFFENKDALDRFTANKFEFSGQASAVAVKSGASANAQYRDGVQVFTQEKGGLMLEASVGGQKFTYKAF